MRPENLLILECANLASQVAQGYVAQFELKCEKYDAPGDLYKHDIACHRVGKSRDAVEMVKHRACMFWLVIVGDPLGIVAIRDEGVRQKVNSEALKENKGQRQQVFIKDPLRWKRVFEDYIA